MSRAHIPGARLTGAEAGLDLGPDAPLVGVLALQGDVLEHLRALGRVGARAVEVKRAEELDGLAGLVIPGGESTTIGRLAVLYGLLEPLRACAAEGLPVLGTCAGAILMGRKALASTGAPTDQPLLGVMDAVLRRNAFGRQVASFDGEVEVAGIDGGPLPAAFIRAPWFEETGPDVEVLGRVDTVAGARVVVVRQGRLLASAFHPELTGDDRLHRLFLGLVQTYRIEQRTERQAAGAG